MAKRVMMLAPFALIPPHPPLSARAASIGRRSWQFSAAAFSPRSTQLVTLMLPS